MTKSKKNVDEVKVDKAKVEETKVEKVDKTEVTEEAKEEIDSSKLVITPVEDAPKAEPEVKAESKPNPATGKVDHNCEDNYRTISRSSKSTKQCRICGIVF